MKTVTAFVFLCLIHFGSFSTSPDGSSSAGHCPEAEKNNILTFVYEMATSVRNILKNKITIMNFITNKRKWDSTQDAITTHREEYFKYIRKLVWFQLNDHHCKTIAHHTLQFTFQMSRLAKNDQTATEALENEAVFQFDIIYPKEIEKVLDILRRDRDNVILPTLVVTGTEPEDLEQELIHVEHRVTTVIESMKAAFRINHDRLIELLTEYKDDAARWDHFQNAIATHDEMYIEQMEQLREIAVNVGHERIAKMILSALRYSLNFDDIVDEHVEYGDEDKVIAEFKHMFHHEPVIRHNDHKEVREIINVSVLVETPHSRPWLHTPRHRPWVEKHVLNEELREGVTIKEHVLHLIMEMAHLQREIHNNVKYQNTFIIYDHTKWELLNEQILADRQHYYRKLQDLRNVAQYDDSDARQHGWYALKLSFVLDALIESDKEIKNNFVTKFETLYKGSIEEILEILRRTGSPLVTDRDGNTYHRNQVIVTVKEEIIRCVEGIAKRHYEMRREHLMLQTYLSDDEGWEGIDRTVADWDETYIVYMNHLRHIALHIDPYISRMGHTAMTFIEEFDVIVTYSENNQKTVFGTKLNNLCPGIYAKVEEILKQK